MMVFSKFIFRHPRIGIVNNFLSNRCFKLVHVFFSVFFLPTTTPNSINESCSFSASSFASATCIKLSVLSTFFCRFPGAQATGLKVVSFDAEDGVGDGEEAHGSEGGGKKVGGIITEKAKEGVAAACVLPLDDSALIAGAGEVASVFFKH